MKLNADFASFFRASPGVPEMVAECLESGRAFRRVEANVHLSDGRVRRLGLSITPISDGSQNVEGALCLITDITEVVELRERMQLKDNLASLGEMAAGIAHEFKNSLATIHGYVQLLEAQLGAVASNTSTRETVNATLNEVRLLARLVTDFLNFARPQQLHLAPVELRSTIEESAEEVRPALAQAKVRLTIQGEFGKIYGDESLLKRVFVNLLRNAAEAIDPQSDDRLITVDGSVDRADENGYANVRVTDTGSGIAAEHLHRIFIPFFTTKSRGYGIGLALVQKIVVAHGGDVTIERSDKTGTVFHCRLPLSQRLDVERA
jgi:signal transduction histidine kinase